MNQSNNKFTRKGLLHQGGATLVVSLVILTIVTVLGLASMRNSNLELKMAASTRDHSIAFQNAESALHLLERQMVEPVSAYTRDQVESNCSSSRGCFDAACSNGLCFDGVLNSDTTDQNCRIAKGIDQAKQMWRQSAIWENASTYSTKSIPNSQASDPDNQIKYIVEFLCFATNPDITATSDKDTIYPLYRVTVRSEGEAKRSTAMLQSIFRGAAYSRNLTEEEPVPGAGDGEGGGDPVGDPVASNPGAL